MLFSRQPTRQGLRCGNKSPTPRPRQNQAGSEKDNKPLSALEKAGLVDPAKEDEQQAATTRVSTAKPAEGNKPPSALEKAGLVKPAEGGEEKTEEKDKGLLRSTVPELETTRRRGNFDQQRLRTDQVRLIQRQANTELVISMLVCAVVAIVLWGVATPVLLTGWATAVILSVGSRSLFISGRQSEKTHDEFNAWGTKYIVAIILSGSCWGGLGIFSVLYAELVQQVFVLFILAGICLTAYVSLQSSTKTTAAFILPAMLPMTACLIYQSMSVANIIERRIDTPPGEYYTTRPGHIDPDIYHGYAVFLKNHADHTGQVHEARLT